MYTRKIALLIALIICHSLYCKKAVDQSWSGDYYNEHSDPQYKVAMSMLKDNKLRDYQNILDIGCGSGKITEKIASMSPNATIEAIDASENMVNAARRKYTKLDKVRFSVEDAQKLPYKEKFDLVISCSCIHWIKDKKALFDGIAKALKPEGMVLIVGCAKSDKNPISKAILELKDILPWSLFLADVDPDTQFFPIEKESAEKALTKAGLEPLEVNEIFFPLTFKNKDDMANWIFGWLGGVSALSKLTDENRKLFAQTVAEHYSMKAPRGKRGSIIYNWPLAIIKAKKQPATSHAQNSTPPS